MVGAEGMDSTDKRDLALPRGGYLLLYWSGEYLSTIDAQVTLEA